LALLVVGVAFGNIALRDAVERGNDDLRLEIQLGDTMAYRTGNLGNVSGILVINKEARP
jgi:hypothetical protein